MKLSKNYSPPLLSHLYYSKYMAPNERSVNSSLAPLCTEHVTSRVKGTETKIIQLSNGTNSQDMEEILGKVWNELITSLGPREFCYH